MIPVSPSVLAHARTTPSAHRYAVPDELLRRFEAFHDDSLRYRRVSPATAKWYRESFRAFLKFLARSGVSFIESATAGHLLTEWLASSLAGSAERAPISPFTAKSYWQALRAFFLHLEKNDRFPNPYRDLDPPGTPDVLPKALEFDQCVRVLDAARNTTWASRYERARAVAMIAMALYAGLRRKEILGLKVEHVQLPARRILVDKGKGRNGGKQRVAYMSDELATILEEYLQARGEAGLESVEFFTAIVPRRGGGRDAALLRRDPILRKHSGHGVKVKTFNRIIARVRTTAGFRFSVHMLRHSFVSMLARDPDVTPQLLKELAGHRDYRTTERYLRLFDPDKLRAVSRLSFTPRDRGADPRRA